MNETEAPDTRPRHIKKKMKKSEPAAGPWKKTNQTKKKKKKKDWSDLTPNFVLALIAWTGSTFSAEK